MSLVRFEDLPVEALTEVAQEKFQEALWATEKALAKQLEFGRVMLIVKSKLPHGEWCNWVRDTFDDQISLRSIQCHMKASQAIAQNPALLECADSLDDILKTTAKPKTAGVTVNEPIEATATPVKQLREPKPASNPRSDAAPRNSKPAAPEFDLGSSLDEHRSAILEMAGDYHAAKKTKHFIVMLRKVAADLEVATPGGAN
jgi:hypothetical protein